MWSDDGARINAITAGMSRRRVSLNLPEIIPAVECDPQLNKKISGELAAILSQLMQQFSQSQQNSDVPM